MIEILTNLKKTGKETGLWYHPFQGERFDLCLDTKKGYLVKRNDVESSKMYLVKHKHGVFIEPEYDEDVESIDELDDDIV